MIEPTETEDKGELDRFIEALIKIREEIEKVEKEIWDKTDNPLKNAPHTEEFLLKEPWVYCYSRLEAAYPLPWVKSRGKYWPTVSRLNNEYGDANLECSCRLKYE